MIANKIVLTALISAIALGGAVGTADAKMRKHHMASARFAQTGLEESRSHEGAEGRGMERKEHRMLRKMRTHHQR